MATFAVDGDAVSRPIERYLPSLRMYQKIKDRYILQCLEGVKDGREHLFSGHLQYFAHYEKNIFKGNVLQKKTSLPQQTLEKGGGDEWKKVVY